VKKRSSGIHIIFFGAFLLSFISCSKDPSEQIEDIIPQKLPAHFDAIQYPEDNRFTQARWELGKRLFYDNLLSSNQSINCGSCHKAEFAFGDNRPTSPGVEHRPGTRNAPSLSNVAFQPYFLREGSNATLEQQIFVPIQEHNEFDFNILLIANRMNQDSSYIRQSLLAYDRIPDPYVITRSIANFERTLISSNSKYDKHLEGIVTLTSSEKRGLAIFQDKNCSSCHSGFNFSNYAFENNGLYENYNDVGRERFTQMNSDIGKFKVPSLRNVGLSAPYMHDGSLARLEDVIEHYDNGGTNHFNQSELVRPLNLTARDKEDLIIFLHTLTDTKFVSDKRFHDE